MIEMWMILAISAVMFWTISSLIDRNVMLHHIKRPVIPLFIVTVVSFIVSLGILAHNFVSLPLFYAGLCLFAGSLYAISTFFFFKSVLVEEISRVIPLTYTAAFFVLILAALFLQEPLTTYNYIGVVSLAIGAIVISVKKSTRFELSKAFWFTQISALCIAISAVTMKYVMVAEPIDYTTVFAYSRIGWLLGLIPFAIIYAKDLKNITKKTKKTLGLMTISGVFATVGAIASLAAISIGFVSLVGGMLSIQPLVVLIFAAVIGLYYPKILQEEIKGSIIALKVLAIALIIIGAFLVM